LKRQAATPAGWVKQIRHHKRRIAAVMAYLSHRGKSPPIAEITYTLFRSKYIFFSIVRGFYANWNDEIDSNSSKEKHKYKVCVFYLQINISVIYYQNIIKKTKRRRFNAKNN